MDGEYFDLWDRIQHPFFQGLIDDEDVDEELRPKKRGKKNKRKTTKTTIYDVSLENCKSNYVKN